MDVHIIFNKRNGHLYYIIYQLKDTIKEYVYKRIRKRKEKIQSNNWWALLVTIELKTSQTARTTL